MANVNFYLKNPHSIEATPINLHFSFNGQRLKLSTGESIEPKKWNFNNQSVKKSATGSMALNGYLQSMKSTIEEIYRNACAAKMEVTPDYLKEKLLTALNKKSTAPKGFYDVLNEYFEYRKPHVSINYQKRIKTLINHLREFEKKKRFKLSFAAIDLKFHDQFTNYLLNEKNQLNNTIGGIISSLKTFLLWATSRGYNSNKAFKEREFKTFQQQGEIVYLTNDELMHLFNLDLSENSRLFNVRETFCFACFTGLRFSDISKVRREMIKGDELFLTTQKTKNSISIPLNDYAMEILHRNNFQLTVISNQKFNSYLKELCKLAELNEPTLITKFRGAEAVEFVKPKHDFISTHTARRTFITLSLEKGMRAETVMEITGHKSYKMFKRYIKITDKIKRIEMQKAWRKPQPEPALMQVG